MTSFERPTNPTPLKIERPAIRVLSDKGSVVLETADADQVRQYLANLPTLKGYMVAINPTMIVPAKNWLKYIENADARQKPDARPARKPDTDLIVGTDDPRHNPACPYCQKGTPHHHNAEWRQAMLRRQGIGRA